MGGGTIVRPFWLGPHVCPPVNLVGVQLDVWIIYVHDPYTGFLCLWIDCRRHMCANVGRFVHQYIDWEVLPLGGRGDCEGGGGAGEEGAQTSDLL